MLAGECGIIVNSRKRQECNVQFYTLLLVNQRLLCGGVTEAPQLAEGELFCEMLILFGIVEPKE